MDVLLELILTGIFFLTFSFINFFLLIVILRFFAFRHLEKAGAVITTSECVIFGLVEDSKHPKFQEIRKLILEPAPDSGLENF